MLIVRQDLVVKEIPIPGAVEFLAAQIECAGKTPLIVCGLYRPPNTNLDYMVDLCSCITKVASEYQACPVWIGGDINLPDIDWESCGIISNTIPKTFNYTFIQCLEDNNLEQIVSFPTRGDNTLDVLPTNRQFLRAGTWSRGP